MLRKELEMLVENREKMRGGDGIIKIKNLFKAEELRGKTRLIAEVTIPVGGSIGYHIHENEEEIYYFISGNGEVDDNGVRKQVSAGDAMLTGEGKGHAVYNTGNTPLILMAIILLY
ncbi:MAG TPA: cupin domain-containing protein, partial [Bacillota bacterium]|nr:cupin domain-containing protein [Bacillota bacterium]HPO97465.1 cupin domain-containing protein [Bacillota bacterium]